ncbi:hypothetical protein N658DRAFT_402511, partial [Parathielavia hyrcaniae]
MPAIPPAFDTLRRLIHARDTPLSHGPRPVPPFYQPDEGDDNIAGPFPLESGGRDKGLSPGIIAAIVISVVVFLVVVMGLFAYLGYRRRGAVNGEVARKEASTSPSVVTASGALDPPPPYQRVHDAGHYQAREGRRGSEGGIAGEEEDSDGIGSHATITDGMAP